MAPLYCLTIGNLREVTDTLPVHHTRPSMLEAMGRKKHIIV